MATPPTIIPEELYSRYTLNNRIPVETWYFNEAMQHTEFPWTDALIKMYLKRFSLSEIEGGPIEHENYTGAANYHYQAFRKLPEAIEGKHIAVIGSLSPWIEVICLQFGAASVTTVEYNVPNKTSYIDVMSYTDFEKVENRFDTIVSYSSIEHSGLGRYGDPLCPEGDLITMKHCHKALKQSGHLFLGLPIGKDTLVWNAHRVYGPMRLPLLLEGFEELFWIGGIKARCFTYDYMSHKQPIIALRKL